MSAAREKLSGTTTDGGAEAARLRASPVVECQLPVETATSTADPEAGASSLVRTPLHAFHVRHGARMVPFAGYDLPLHYPTGLLGEHVATRAAAGLFDVSHMGQITVAPRTGDMAGVAEALETVLPIDVVGLAPGRQRYAILTTPDGGILDDLMVANLGDRFLLVVNASRKAVDEAHLRAALPASCAVMPSAHALLAMQGPASEAALAALAPDVVRLLFMDARTVTLLGLDCVITRSGYTGEDGFEISVPASGAEELAEALLRHPSVVPVGLGARDSLRLEAALCLYGADIDTTTSPVEAGLTWAIQPVRRRNGARAGGFPGAARILAEAGDGPARRRVSLRPEGCAPVRGGAPLFAGADEAVPVGAVTSGGFGPSVGGPVALGYLPAALSEVGTRVFADVRGQRLPVTVTRGPFIPPRFKRG